MDQPVSSSERGNALLAQIRTGMQVFDLAGEKVGTVESVQLGRIEQIPDERTATSFREADSNQGGRRVGGRGLGQIIEDAFDPNDQISEAVQDRMLGQGFIRVGGNRLHGEDRYITPDLIETVTRDMVRLNVVWNRLEKS